MATVLSVNSEAWWSSRVDVKWLLCVSPPSGASDFAEPASGTSLPPPALSWVWLVDLERTVALLVGRCLGGMLQGAPTSLEEQDTAYWLKTPLFSNGLEMETPQLGRTRARARACWGRRSLLGLTRFPSGPSDTSISCLLEAALSGNEEQKPLECSLQPDMSVLVELALGSSKEPVNSLWINMQDYAISKGLWSTFLLVSPPPLESCVLTGVVSCRLGQRVPQ